MKKYKNILLPVLFILISTIFIFIIELFLNERQTEFLMVIIFILSILSILYGIMQLIAGKSKLKFISRRRDGFLIIALTAICFTSIIYISAFNIGIYQAFDREFTAFEKIKMYKTLNIASKEMDEHNSDMESHLIELNREKIDHMEIYYGEGIKIEHLNVIKDTIPLAIKLAEDVFGDLEKEPLKIILYGPEEKFKDDRLNSNLVQGYFDGFNIHIKSFIDEEAIWAIERLFIHEYSHYVNKSYFLENKIHKHLPTWFDEGVAEYIAIYEKNMEYSLGYFENSIDIKKLESTQDFIKALESGQDLDKFYDPYVHSYYMIDSLVDMKGERVITDLILKSKDMDFYEAFEDIVGVSIEDYQNISLVEYVEKMSQDKEKI